MGIKQARGEKGKCDKLVRQILLTQHNKCERCGSQEWLQVSHIISRRYSATRCDLDNVQLLCARCHRRFTDWPREFSHWITNSIGSEKYDELSAKANQVTKMDWTAERQRLETVLKQSTPD